MIGTLPIGVTPVGVPGVSAGNEYIAQGGAQSGGSADLVYTQAIPSLTINGTSGVRRYGGVAASSLSVTEIMV